MEAQKHLEQIQIVSPKGITTSANRAYKGDILAMPKATGCWKDAAVDPEVGETSSTVNEYNIREITLTI